MIDRFQLQNSGNINKSPGNEAGMERTGESLGLIRGYCPQMLQIALVSDKHDNDVRIRMIPQLLQPPRNIDIGCVFGNIVNEQCADSTTVISERNRLRLAS
jgi:hypothetical protein